VPREVRRWATALLECGAIDSLQQIGPDVLRRDGREPDFLPVTLAARGRTAGAAAEVLARYLCMTRVDAAAVPDTDLVVVLGDALGPRVGTVVCDVLVPGSLAEVLDACRHAVRGAAATQVPVMLLRRAPVTPASTHLSVMIAPEEVDPPYDIACVASQMIDVLGSRASSRR
jgi:hypothetical protein